MKNMFRMQRGMTFIGLVFVLAFIAIVVLFGLRAFPLIYEKTQVKAAMESVVNREGSSKFTAKEAQDAFLRGIGITNIQRFNEKNLKDYLILEKSKEKNAPNVLHLKYQATNKLVADLQLLLMVDISMPLAKGGTGD
ncbi:MAG: hypothetical protein HW411_1440 [Gammaproteobacteria bacterium]|nr:hypothetical protein [Gammaproteobacteria bacterium]